MSGRISPTLSIPVSIPILSTSAENNPHLLSSEVVTLSEEGRHDILQKFVALKDILKQRDNEIISLQSKLAKVEEFEKSLQTAVGDIRAKGEANAALKQEYEVISERLLAKNQRSANELEAEKQANIELRQQHEVIHEKSLIQQQELEAKNQSVVKRCNAVWVLKKQLELTKSPERIETICLALEAASRDNDVKIKTYVAIALGQYKALPKAKISILLGAVKNERSSVRERDDALWALERQLELTESLELRDAICSALKAALRGDNAEIKTYVAIILGRYNKALSNVEMPILFEAVQNEKFSMAIRAHVVWALEKQLKLTESPELTEAICLSLKAVLRDDDLVVRTEAAIAVGLHKALSNLDMPILLGAVQNKKLTVGMRRSAAWVLAKQLKLTQAPDLREAICLTLELHRERTM